METICALILLCSICGAIFIYKELLGKKIESRKKDEATSHLRKITEKIMPNNPCMTVSPNSELHCLKPATHIYAGLSICSDCAEKFVGAIPPPERFDFEKQVVLA